MADNTDTKTATIDIGVIVLPVTGDSLLLWPWMIGLLGALGAIDLLLAKRRQFAAIQ